MTPLRKAVALLNIGIEAQTVLKHLIAMGLDAAHAHAVLAAAELQVALTPVS